MSTSALPDGFSITRILPANPEGIWEALTDPDALSQWWRTGHAVTPYDEIQLDLQIGGHYRYTMIDGETGARTVTGGMYQELDAPHRIAFTWDDYRAQAEASPLVVFTLETQDDDTLLFFELRGASGAPGDHFFYDGCAEALDHLQTYLTTSTADDW